MTKKRESLAEVFLAGIVLGALALTITVVLDAVFVDDSAKEEEFEERLYQLEQRIAPPTDP